MTKKNDKITTYHLGKKPASPLRAGSIRWREVRGYFLQGVQSTGNSLPPIPEHFGYGGDFAGGDSTGDWMMGANGPPVEGFPDTDALVTNGGCGDCTIIGREHQIMMDNKNANRDVPSFSDPTTVGTYTVITAEENNGQGFDPVTGDNDNGADVQGVVSYYQTTGFPDDKGVRHKGGQALWLEPGDLQDLWECCLVGGSVGVGWVITQANMDQSNNNQPWSYVAGSPQDGGHYTPVVGRANSRNGGTITWSKRQGFTPDMYTKQSDEAVLVIDLEEFNKTTGLNVETYDQQDVALYCQMLGQKWPEQQTGW